MAGAMGQTRTAIARARCRPGNGSPAPIFSVGYVAMARKKTTAGGFYSYIGHGLGREIGIGTGFGPVLTYFDVRLSSIILGIG